jgi:preprotein translocase SecE subunit
MAKSRAQRKAEAAKRRALQQEGRQPIESDSEAQHDTQVPVSADVLEAEIAMEQGAAEADREAEREAPAPSRADVGRPDQGDGEQALSRRERRRQEREQAQRTKAQMERRAAKPAAPERQRGPVISFFQSVWRELQKVQWPDRDTLVQASAVTLLFVAVAAAYLGALDAIFSRLVDLLIT